MRLYLAGPMRGYPLFNFPAFDEAAAALRRLGHEVFSPADNDREHGFDEERPMGENEYSLQDALLADLTYILTQAEAVVVLPDYTQSLGAMTEVHTAWCIGIPVYHLKDFLAGYLDWKIVP